MIGGSGGGTILDCVRGQCCGGRCNFDRHLRHPTFRKLGTAEQQILLKPLHLPRLGIGAMRVTTAHPDENARFLSEIKDLLRSSTCD